MKDNNEFGDLLREARKSSKLSAREASEKVGVSLTFIYDIEKGRKSPTLETVTKLADAYNRPDLIVTYKDKKHIPKIELLYDTTSILMHFERLNRLDDANIKDEDGFKKTQKLRNQIAHGTLDEIHKHDPEAFEEVLTYLKRKLKDIAKDDEN